MVNRSWTRLGAILERFQLRKGQVSVQRLKKGKAMKTIEIARLKLHKEADRVPSMRDSEYQEFLADIRERGIRVPLEIMGDTILDGRSRFQAAKELGLKTV